MIPISFEDFWHSKYDLGNEASEGLVLLLNKFPRNFISDFALDVGCGKGRNICVIKRYSNYLVGIEPDIDAVESQNLNIAGEVINKMFQEYLGNQKAVSDLIIAWRVLKC